MDCLGKFLPVGFAQGSARQSLAYRALVSGQNLGPSFLMFDSQEMVTCMALMTACLYLYLRVMSWSEAVSWIPARDLV